MKQNNKYFEQNPDPMQINSVSQLLTEEESLLWEGKPKKSAYVANAVARGLLFVIIWLLVDGFFIYILSNGDGEIPWFLWLFFAFHLLPVYFWIAGILHALAEIKNIQYAITDKRIIIRSGVIIDLKFLYFTDINAINVKVGIVDRFFKVGDIYITANIQTAVLYDIPDPYRVANYIQQCVRYIQTDIHFHNAYRPKENTGFNT